MNTNEIQNVNVIGGNIQNGIPTQQADPTLVPNAHYLPSGHLTIASIGSLNNWTVRPVSIPITAVSNLFEVTTNSTEQNLIVDDEFRFYVPSYKPRNIITVPNIAYFIGAVITGAELSQKYLESMLVCTTGYLNGTMEILASGTFMNLNQVRDGRNRRYSRLCTVINYALSGNLYSPDPHLADVATEQQAQIQAYFMRDATSMLVRLKKAIVNDTEYTVTKSMLSQWALSTPWHALMYNSQAPMEIDDFIRLFINVYAIHCGKRIVHLDSVPLDTDHATILPNFDLFTALNPPNTQSVVNNISTAIPTRFISFTNLLYYTIENELEWSPPNEDGEDVQSEDDTEEEDNSDDSEENDSDLAY